MDDRTEGISVGISLDAGKFKSELSELGALGESFGRNLVTSLAGAIFSGKKLSDVLKKLILQFSERALSMALAPLSSGVGSLFGQLFQGLTASAKGNVFTGGRPTPFARGGVVNSPALFPLRGGTGLMGEAGPEAILPLARGANGKLGVQSGGGARPVQIVMNIQTSDAESFKRSKSQISAMVSRAAERGGRNL